MAGAGQPGGTVARHWHRGGAGVAVGVVLTLWVCLLIFLGRANVYSMCAGLPAGRHPQTTVVAGFRGGQRGLLGRGTPTWGRAAVVLYGFPPRLALV